MINSSYEMQPRKPDAYRMAQAAAYFCIQQFGIYPERIALDAFSRYHELIEQIGTRYLELQELVEPIPETWTEETQLTFNRVFIQIEPALFEKPVFRPGSPIIQIPQEPGGPDEVLYWRSGKMTHMSIWFSANGYDAIIWDGIEVPNDQ